MIVNTQLAERGYLKKMQYSSMYKKYFRIIEKQFCIDNYVNKM